MSDIQLCRRREGTGAFAQEDADATFALLSEPQPNGCVLWKGGRWGEYGRFRRKQAHAWAYERKHGPLPKGVDLHHKCEEKLCVNEAHVAPKTRRAHFHEHHPDNPTIVNANKTHCDHGHAFDEANTSVTVKGYRRCLACERMRNAGHRKRLHASGPRCVCAKDRPVWAKGVCLACYRRLRRAGVQCTR